MQTEESEAHSCTECSRTFKTLRELQRHFSSKHNKKYLQDLIVRLSYPKVNSKILIKQGKESNNRLLTRFFLLRDTQPKDNQENQNCTFRS